MNTINALNCPEREVFNRHSPYTPGSQARVAFIRKTVYAIAILTLTTLGVFLIVEAELTSAILGLGTAGFTLVINPDLIHLPLPLIFLSSLAWGAITVGSAYCSVMYSCFLPLLRIGLASATALYTAGSITWLHWNTYRLSQTAKDLVDKVLNNSATISNYDPLWSWSCWSTNRSAFDLELMHRIQEITNNSIELNNNLHNLQTLMDLLIGRHQTFTALVEWDTPLQIFEEDLNAPNTIDFFRQLLVDSENPYKAFNALTKNTQKALLTALLENENFNTCYKLFYSFREVNFFSREPFSFFPDAELNSSTIDSLQEIIRDLPEENAPEGRLSKKESLFHSLIYVFIRKGLFSCFSYEPSRFQKFWTTLGDPEYLSLIQKLKRTSVEFSPQEQRLLHAIQPCILQIQPEEIYNIALPYPSVFSIWKAGKTRQDVFSAVTRCMTPDPYTSATKAEAIFNMLSTQEIFDWLCQNRYQQQYDTFGLDWLDLKLKNDLQRRLGRLQSQAKDVRYRLIAEVFNSTKAEISSNYPKATMPLAIYSFWKRIESLEEKDKLYWIRKLYQNKEKIFPDHAQEYMIAWTCILEAQNIIESESSDFKYFSAIGFDPNARKYSEKQKPRESTTNEDFWKYSWRHTQQDFRNAYAQQNSNFFSQSYFNHSNHSRALTAEEKYNQNLEKQEKADRKQRIDNATNLLAQGLSGYNDTANISLKEFKAFVQKTHPDKKAIYPTLSSNQNFALFSSIREAMKTRGRQQITKQEILGYICCQSFYCSHAV